MRACAAAWAASGVLSSRPTPGGSGCIPPRRAPFGPARRRSRRRCAGPALTSLEVVAVAIHAVHQLAQHTGTRLPWLGRPCVCSGASASPSCLPIGWVRTNCRRGKRRSTPRRSRPSSMRSRPSVATCGSRRTRQLLSPLRRRPIHTHHPRPRWTCSSKPPAMPLEWPKSSQT
jgi:hypothetical protein